MIDHSIRKAAWDKVLNEASRIKGVAIKDISGVDEAVLDTGDLGLIIDTSRQRLDSAAWSSLYNFAEAAKVKEALAGVFSGAHQNISEGRAVLHWTLRGSESFGLNPAEYARQRKGIDDATAYAKAVRAGEVKASSGKLFKTILHIGIGGSDFGPRLVADAFHMERDQAFDLRFAANVDPHDLDLALDGADPSETLVIGVSKSFSTKETLYNMARARAWLVNGVGEANVSKHLVAITAKGEKAVSWGGADLRTFDLTDEIGGRFSLWSAAILACEIALGPDIIKGFRDGGAAVDAVMKNAPLRENPALRLALVDLWNASAMGEASRILACYSRRLKLLTAYLQQLEMESNGKSVGPDGQPTLMPTAAILWGGEGTIGQHSYHQWLHQGQGTPAEFLLSLSPNTDDEGNLALSANAFAQADALRDGRLVGTEDVIDLQRNVPGDRPSTFILTPEMTPETLGKLIALYEYRTIFGGALWGINPFDQWGVELGKVMATGIESELTDAARSEGSLLAALQARVKG